MNKSFTILVAEDDPNDVHLLQRAFRKNGINNPVQTCSDGEETIAYLRGEGKYANREAFPVPEVIFLDIKMPKKTGFDVLQWLQTHKECAVIPTIVLTSSDQQTDIQRAYQLGANSYLMKPASFDDLVKMTNVVFEYWSWCKTPPVPRSC